MSACSPHWNTLRAAPINFSGFPFLLSSSSGLFLTPGFHPTWSHPCRKSAHPTHLLSPGNSRAGTRGLLRLLPDLLSQELQRLWAPVSPDLLLTGSSSRNQSSGQVSPRSVLLEDQDRSSEAGMPYTAHCGPELTGSLQESLSLPSQPAIRPLSASSAACLARTPSPHPWAPSSSP